MNPSQMQNADAQKIMEQKTQFIEIYQQKVTRPGADKFLGWLEITDFFTAPASTRFHLSCPGGLVEHSLHVYDRLQSLYRFEKTRKGKGLAVLTPEEEESIAICSLLHDVCKANFYDVEMRNRKNEQGVWEKYPFYVIKDQFPYGHGEKSVLLISKYMELKDEELMAIRWHMGGCDESAKGGSHSHGGAFRKYPLALLTHLADMQASYLDEVEDE